MDNLSHLEEADLVDDRLDQEGDVHLHNQEGDVHLLVVVHTYRD